MSQIIHRRILRKNLGKSMIYFNQTTDQLQEQSERAFLQMRKYTKPDTTTLTHRLQ